jgi:hypothetical protein
MKMIRLIAYIPLITCLGTANIFTMEPSTDNSSQQELDDAATKESNMIDDAARILTSMRNRQSNDCVYVPLQEAVKIRTSPELAPNKNNQSFVKYAYSGNYEKVESILNDQNKRTLFSILSNAQAMFRIIFRLSTSKREFHEPSNDILLTLDILLSDKQIQDLLDKRLTEKLLTRLTQKGNALRLDAFMRHDDIVTKISREKALGSIAFLVRRGCNGMLKILLDNKKICSFLDQDSAIEALKLSEEGQADKVRHAPLLTLLENNTIYNLVKDLDLTQYLSTESLRYIRNKTQNNNVLLLVKKFI